MLKSLSPKGMTNSEQHVTDLIKNRYRHMKNYIIKIITLCSLLLFTGCFEIVEEVTFNKDGSGAVKLTFNLSSSRSKINSLMLLDSVNDYKIPSKKDIQHHFDKIAATIAKTKGITKVKKTSNYEEFIFSISCNFSNVDVLNTVISNFGTVSESKKINANKHFTFDKEKNVFTRNYHYDLVKEFKKVKSKDKTVFSKANIATIYRFAQPIKSSKNKTAKISPSRKAIMLRVDVADMVTGKESVKNSIELEKE